MLSSLFKSFRSTTVGDLPDLSRRRFLSHAVGLGVVAAIGPALVGLAPADAKRVADPEPAPETAKPAQEYQLAQSERRDRNRRPSGRSRRRDDRRRRQLRRRCANSRRFRRENPRLCRSVSGGRRRRGSCVWIGNIQICD